MISLFSGIGLLDLGLERAGLGSPSVQVEIDPWCRRVLERHYPNAKRHDDVKTFVPAEPARIVCGGFPCQPVSVAGKGLAQADARWLWPEYARIVEQARPGVVVVENVPGLRTRGLRIVLADLAALGFDAEWTHFSAGAVGAPHKRDRLWLVATHPERVTVREQPGWLGRAVGAAVEAQYRLDREVLDSDTDGLGRVQHAVRVATLRGWAGHCGWHLGDLARVDDGRARRVVRDLGRKRRALGNSVVVRCAEIVGRAVRAAAW